ncbi:hypothetical protein FRC19_005575 [Serendipita sp. 401]|nr:hypothetical protein FRC19_005575 [Serendipita sp. 401]
MALSPNGRVVAETPWSRVFVWNVDTRQRVELPHGVESPVLSLNFSPNSELLAAEFRQSAGSLNLCVWNVHTQTQVWKQTSDGTGAWYSYCLGFSPDSSSIMSFDEHYIYIANINSKDDIYGHHTDRIYYIRGAVSPTGTFMAVLAAERADSNKKRIEIMEIGRRLRRVDVIFFSDTSDKHQLTFSGDGKYIACGPLCWDISSIPAQLHIGPLPPASFEQTLHSFLTFKDGWIHSAYPPGPLLPIPSYFQGRVTDSWYLCGNYAILKWSQSGPLVVDCIANNTTSSTTNNAGNSSSNISTVSNFNQNNTASNSNVANGPNILLSTFIQEIIQNYTDAIERIIEPPSCVLIPAAYVAGRLITLVIAFQTLSSLPPEAFQSVQWTDIYLAPGRLVASSPNMFPR